MTSITTLDDLHALYGNPSTPALVKVTPHLTPSYRAFLDRSRFCVLTTVGPEGTDGSPRGDTGPVVTVIDPEPSPCPTGKATTASTACAISSAMAAYPSSSSSRARPRPCASTEPKTDRRPRPVPILYPRQQTSPHRHRHSGDAGLFAMRPCPATLGAVDQWRPI